MICVSIVENDLAVALQALAEASQVADLVEIRLDALRSPEVLPFLKASDRPLLFTFRDVREGGLRSVSLEKRLPLLLEALKRGASLVDLELASGEEAFGELLEARKEAQRVLASFHDFSGTPSLQVLREVASQMKAFGVDIGKIVTTARTPEDNLSVLSLIPWAQKELSLPLIAFAMGPLGRLSRVAAPLLGAPFTYAALPGRSQAAPGQLSAVALREIFQYLQTQGGSIKVAKG